MTDEERPVGVGPHSRPWPDDLRFDPELLEHGDVRNVADEYRYWPRDAIVADLDTRRNPFHVAIENWQHDFNIGTIVRNANAFLAHTVHIVGKRRWNKRGAMVTDRYQHIQYHTTIDEFRTWSASETIDIIGIDISYVARPREHAMLPGRCVLVFGQEGPVQNEAPDPPIEAGRDFDQQETQQADRPAPGDAAGRCVEGEMQENPGEEYHEFAPRDFHARQPQ